MRAERTYSMPDARIAEFFLNQKICSDAANPGSIILLNTVTGEVIQKLDARGSKIDCLSFAPDGLTLATAGEDGKIETWDLTARRITRT